MEPCSLAHSNSKLDHDNLTLLGIAGFARLAAPLALHRLEPTSVPRPYRFLYPTFRPPRLEVPPDQFHGVSYRKHRRISLQHFPLSQRKHHRGPRCGARDDSGDGF